jgi:hypothetical protein
MLAPVVEFTLEEPLFTERLWWRTMAAVTPNLVVLRSPQSLVVCNEA